MLFQVQEEEKRIKNELDKSHLFLISMHYLLIINKQKSMIFQEKSFIYLIAIIIIHLNQKRNGTEKAEGSPKFN